MKTAISDDQISLVMPIKFVTRKWKVATLILAPLLVLATGTSFVGFVAIANGFGIESYRQQYLVFLCRDAEESRKLLQAALIGLPRDMVMSMVKATTPTIRFQEYEKGIRLSNVEVEFDIGDRVSNVISSGLCNSMAKKSEKQQ